MDLYRDILAPTTVNAFVALNSGDSLYSACRSMRLIMQEDGNLVLYVIEDRNLPRDPVFLGQMDVNAWAELSDQNNPNNPYTGALWWSGTNGLGQFAQARFQWDGNLVVYDKDGKPHFDTGTNGNFNAFLRCQDDGFLAIYDQFGRPLWNSGFGRIFF